jgi:tryptophan-rich sensory protein
MSSPLIIYKELKASNQIITVLTIGIALSQLYSLTGRYPLRLPSFIPSQWVFICVWIVMYWTSAAAVSLVWNRFPRNKQFWTIIALFCISALLHVLWTPMLTYYGAIFLALFVAILNFITVLALISMIGKQSLLIAALLTPYLAWLVYAIILNATMLIMKI